MSSSKPRDAFGRFSRTDPPIGDGGDDNNGPIDPDDNAHADNEPLRERSDSVDLPSQIPEGGDPDAGTDGNNVHEDETNPENERCENNDDTDALREAVKRGLQQWVDSLTSQQDFNDATEAFRSAGIAIPVPSQPMADSHTGRDTSDSESQPAKKYEDRAKGEDEEDDHRARSAVMPAGPKRRSRRRQEMRKRPTRRLARRNCVVDSSEESCSISQRHS